MVDAVAPVCQDFFTPTHAEMLQLWEELVLQEIEAIDEDEDF
jgi:hypothetical protein